MPLLSNRDECKDLAQTRVGKKNPSSLNSYCPQKDCYSSSRTVATHTGQQDSHQQNMHIPAREGLYQQEKHLTAKVAPAIATKDFKQQLERGLQLAEKEEDVPAGEGYSNKRNT
jgi:hypothetical protein